MRPNDGFIAYTPHHEPGRIVDPAVCVPSAIGSIPAATATADPPDDVPVTCWALHGLTTAFGVWTANSAVSVLPATIPPSRRI